MKSDRNNYPMMPFPVNNGMPTNMMMYPNYLNDNYSGLDSRVSSLEKKVKTLENRISRLEAPYGNNQNYGMQNNQNNNNNTCPYQTTQNNSGYNGEMYMM